MLLANLKNKFIELLYNSCIKDIAHIKENYSHESFIAYCIYCDDGFRYFDSVGCTKKWLNEQVQTLKQYHKNENETLLYIETFAAEWNYFGSEKIENFSDINVLVYNIFKAYYDDEIEDLNNTLEDFDYDGLVKFFQEVIIAVINQLKASKCFDSKPFERDLLLGLQFGDPSDGARSTMLQISEQVNSPQWHKKMLASYRP